MRIRSVGELKGGEILSEPIFTEEKEILIPKGTRIRKDYIPLIQTLGVETLMIEDPYVDYENPHFLLKLESYREYVAKVKKILEGHIYHETKSLRMIEPLAHELVNDVNQMTRYAVIDMCERSADLYEHTIMVTLLSVIMAKRMNLQENTLLHIAIGSLLHDLGIRYITVPYENCNYNELQPNEIFEYKKHTILAYTALENEKWIPDISRKIILSHHERLNGSGFPLKQRNSELECRIVQICDAFDCMISGMECRRTSVQNALKQLKNASGILFDHTMVDEFVSMIAKYPVGTTVKTNEEENGVVISQTNDPNYPVIMFLDAEMRCETSRQKLNLEEERNISIQQVV